MQAYHPSSRVLVALKNYIASGWTIRIIQWVVGAQGLVHEQHDHCRMYWNFLIYLVLCGTQCVHFSVDALALCVGCNSPHHYKIELLTLTTHYQTK